DGVYFTKFGARKLAHYVEREIQRTINNRGMSVALPVPVDVAPQAPSKPGGPAARPSAGPVLPLTAVRAAPEELIGAARAAPGVGTTPTRVVTKGAPSGRWTGPPRACSPGASRSPLPTGARTISAGRAGMSRSSPRPTIPTRR